ncbi:hypothetical protein QUF90_22155, partial [Desulfococcaceae bacterium HSG9]|nr:hypothetical protein [Desulfococcaceae bacterium HSG9]
NPLLKKKFWIKMELFLSDPFSAQLKTHKLGGKLFGLWSFSVDDDCRVIFEFIEDGSALLIEVGKHDEVY